MTEVFCKDCKYFKETSGQVWTGRGFEAVHTAPECHHPKSESIEPVYGTKQWLTCSEQRSIKEYCGIEGWLFEPAFPAEPKDPGLLG